MMIAELIKLANELDRRGLPKEANAIDLLLKRATAKVQLTPEEQGQLKEEGWTPEATSWYTDVETQSSRPALGLDTPPRETGSLSNDDFAALFDAHQDPNDPFKLTSDIGTDRPLTDDEQRILSEQAKV